MTSPVEQDHVTVERLAQAAASVRRALRQHWERAYENALAGRGLTRALQEAIKSLDPDLITLADTLLDHPDEEQLYAELSSFLKTGPPLVPLEGQAGKPGPPLSHLYAYADGLLILPAEKRERLLGDLPTWLIRRGTEFAQALLSRPHTSASPMTDAYWEKIEWLRRLCPPETRGGAKDAWSAFVGAVWQLHNASIRQQPLPPPNWTNFIAAFVGALPDEWRTLADAVLPADDPPREFLQGLEALEAAALAERVIRYSPATWERVLLAHYDRLCTGYEHQGFGLLDQVRGKQYQPWLAVTEHWLEYAGEQDPAKQQERRKRQQELVQRAARNWWISRLFWGGGAVGLILLVIVLLPMMTRDQPDDATPTPPPAQATEVIDDQVSVVPTWTPSPSPLPGVTEVPLSPGGALEVGDARPCEAGSESWHELVIRNDGPVDTTYALALPPGAQLFSDEYAQECPSMLEPPPVPHDASQPLGPIAQGGSQTWALLLEGNGEMLALTLQSSEPSGWDDSVDIVPWQGDVQATLELEGPQPPGPYVQAEALDVPLTLTVDQPGRYLVVCQDANGGEVGASEPLPVSDVSQSFSTNCHIPADGSAAGQWQALIFPLKRDDTRAEAQVGQPLSFNVEDPRYEIAAARVDYHGLDAPGTKWGVGLGMVYAITNTGNALDNVLIQITTSTEIYMEVLGIAAIDPHGVTHTVSLENNSPYLLLPADALLTPCPDKRDCPAWRVVIWLGTGYRRDISDSKRVEFDVVFMSAAQPEMRQLLNEEITEPPVEIKQAPTPAPVPEQIPMETPVAETVAPTETPAP